MTFKNIQEPLYLQKSDTGKHIYVPEKYNSKLAPHHREGLRFLYKQYKKKKLGAILNDASGHGKKIQVALFLNAIKEHVSQPILLLCNDAELQKWKYHFDTWSDNTDIVYQSNKLYSDKKVYVQTFDDLTLFSRRDWSIAVVDDPISLKMFRSLKNIKASYKIWVISIDLKMHLNTFSAICEWITPNAKFNAEDYTPRGSAKQRIETAIKLDCHFDGLVLRRGETMENLVSPQPECKKNSRKNKDPTGLKVKKSRKMVICDDEYEVNRTRKVEEASKQCDVISDCTKSHEISEINMDFEESHNNFDNSRPNTSNQEVNNDFENHDNPNMDETSSDIAEISETSLQNESNTPYSFNYDFDTMPNEDSSDMVLKMDDTSSDIVNTSNKSSDTENRSLKHNLDTTNDSSSDMVLKMDELSSDTNEIKDLSEGSTEKSNILHNSKISINSAVNCYLNESVYDAKVRHLEETAYNKYKGSLLDQITVSPTKKNITKVTPVSPKEIKPDLKKDNPDTEVTESQALDDKIKDLETKTYKKFKGSLLDTLF